MTSQMRTLAQAGDRSAIACISEAKASDLHCFENAGRYGHHKPPTRVSNPLLASASVLAIVSVLLGMPETARAQNWTGATSNNWMDQTNWSGNTLPTAATDPNIDIMVPNPTVLGVSPGASGTARTINVGSLANSIGSLTVQNGSSLTAYNMVIGATALSSGSVHITGGSTLSGIQDEFQVGIYGSGTFLLDGGSTFTSQDGYTGTTIGVEAGSTGVVTVSGRGTSWTLDGSPAIGWNRGAGGLPAANGELTITNQATLNVVNIVNNDNTVLLSRYGGTGTLAVTQGGILNAPGIEVYSYEGQSTINVESGGSIRSSNVYLSIHSDGFTTATVTGPGSIWTVNGSEPLQASSGVWVGGSGIAAQTNAQATLTIADRGSMVVGGGMFIGTVGTGTVTVTDPGSQLQISGTTFVGNAAASTGTLDIENSGYVRTQNTLVANVAGSTGTVNLTTGGILETHSIQAGAGTPLGNFDGGILRAAGNNPNFITGFTGTQLNIEAGGLTIDDNGFQIANAPTSVFTGTGGLTKIGSGTFTLQGTNTYTGPTAINVGTLQVDGAIATSPVAVNALGTLSGIGTLGGPVNNMGNVMPGDSGTSGVATATGALTMTGAYTGSGGRLTINSVLGGNGSPTSQLVLSGAGASATGNTNVVVNNVGGSGGMTSGNGIQIIQATGGATTQSSAFTLGAPVTAGLYQYQLFQGSAAGGAPDPYSWFLRSHLDNGNGPVPIYRPEGAMFASMPSLGRELTRNTIGTFHDYNGDQGLMRGNGAPGRAWGRVFGQAMEQGHGGLLSPNFNGHSYGFQTGADLFESETPSGFKDRFGVFFGYAQAKGEVRGFALGIQNSYVGDSSLEGLSGGAYWTRVGPREEYLEARVVGTRYTGDGTSFANNTNIDVKGTSFAASLEGGYPIRFGVVTVEPQVQLIYQYLDMKGSDPLSAVGFDTPDALYARAGVRVSSDGLFGWSNVRPYLKANIWQDAVGTDKAIFPSTDVVGTSFRTTALEVGGGVVAQLTQHVGLWGMMDYTTDVSGNQDREIIRGNVGVRIVW